MLHKKKQRIFEAVEMKLAPGSRRTLQSLLYRYILKLNKRERNLSVGAEMIKQKVSDG